MPSSNDTLELTGDDIIAVGSALGTASRLKIIRLLQEEGPMMITEIAKRLDMTEANSSAQVKILEEVGIIEAEYEAGKHGLKKICSVKKNKIVFKL
ncbi:MAG: helix-turn-helix domain-containing protein [Candidatus Lokiarchaeota archaeon]|nr:helix-turn-helix domain-containing protein [Candidatus Lokiarchaeota archaeon]